MAGSHGDLFQEIGRMVVAAHSGAAIDLTRKSEELALRYVNLGVPADTIARAIARSLGAIGVSMALVRHASGAESDATDHDLLDDIDDPLPFRRLAVSDSDDIPVRATAALFPSGVRLAVLS